MKTSTNIRTALALALTLAATGIASAPAFADTTASNGEHMRVEQAATVQQILWNLQTPLSHQQDVQVQKIMTNFVEPQTASIAPAPPAAVAVSTDPAAAGAAAPAAAPPPQAAVVPGPAVADRGELIRQVALVLDSTQAVQFYQQLNGNSPSAQGH